MNYPPQSIKPLSTTHSNDVDVLMHSVLNNEKIFCDAQTSRWPGPQELLFDLR